MKQMSILDKVFSKVTRKFYDIEELAKEILTHGCNPRCLRRISDSDEPEAFVCRKPNNLKLSPDNTQHSYIPLPVKFDEECVKRFKDIGIIEPSTINEQLVFKLAKKRSSLFQSRPSYSPN